MAQFDPGDFALPEFVDPLLDYLSNILPPSVYSFLLTLCSHALALVVATLRLSQALIASKPWEWDAQTVLPPLITLLAAYLALVSAYRTASWMVRTTIFFVKWGAILSALVGGAGWYFAQQRAQGNDMGGWGQSGFTGVLFDLLGKNAQGASRPRSRTRSNNPRPKAHESFDRHREWQYEQEKEARETNAGSGEDVQKIVDQILGTVTEGSWFGMAKGFVNSFAQDGRGGEGEGDDGTERRKQPGRRAKAKRKADSDDVGIDDLD